jgi:hypothetical protein
MSDYVSVAVYRHDRTFGVYLLYENKRKYIEDHTIMWDGTQDFGNFLLSHGIPKHAVDDILYIDR